MAYQKVFSRTHWEDSPSKKTPVNKVNLNKIDYATDVIDDRVIELETTKLGMAVANTMVASIGFDDETGIFTITKLNGSTQTIDTGLEKIAVNFSYDAENERLVITLDDGTIQYVDMAALITEYDFSDSSTIMFTVADSGAVTANIINGSITDAMLESQYLANITIQATTATQAATTATAQATLAQSYAVGGTGTREGEDTDNAKYYKEQAQAIGNIDIATTATAGIVRASDDVTVAPDGTMTVNNSAKLGGYEVNEIASNPNLIINADLKANQRNNETYILDGTSEKINKYFVDRFMITGMSSMQAVFTHGENGGISGELTEHTAQGYIGIMQRIDPSIFNLLAGQKVTMSIHVSQYENHGTNDYKARMYLNDSSEYIGGKAIKGIGTTSVTLTIPTDVTFVAPSFVIYYADTRHGSITGDGMTVDWIKLEVGSVATAFTPPNPFEELLKCGVPDDSNAYGYKKAVVDSDKLGGISANALTGLLGEAQLPTDNDLDNAVTTGTNSFNRAHYCRWNADTLHSPYKQSGLGSTNGGLVMTYYLGTSYGTQVAYPVGIAGTYIRKCSAGVWSDWSDISQLANTITKGYQQGTDLNIFITPGMWLVGSSAYATADCHFPLPGVGGCFEVIGVNNMMMQKYYAYAGVSNYVRIFVRHYWKNTATSEVYWSDWEELFNSVTGGFSKGSIGINNHASRIGYLTQSSSGNLVIVNKLDNSNNTMLTLGSENEELLDVRKCINGVTSVYKGIHTGNMGNYVSNPNILINPDFKINQRGSTSYTGAGAYSVDRWRRYLDTTATVNASGSIALAHAGDGNNSYMISQTIENYADYKGKTLTLSVKYKSNASAGDVRVFVYDGVTTKQTLIATTSAEGIATVTATISESATKLLAGIGIASTVAGSITIEWVKLELGSIATPFCPPDPATELIRCQRYYDVVGSWHTRAFDSIYDITIPFKVTKRITPTVTFTSPNGTEGTIGYWNGTDFTDITPTNNGYSYPWQWRLTGVLNQTGIVRLNLYVDAEIY